MSTVLGVVQVFLCVVLVFLILMHSGKDAGLSGAFGVGTGAGPFGGGSLVERNLNRWTVGFAIAFVVNTIILIKIGRNGFLGRPRPASSRMTPGRPGLGEAGCRAGRAGRPVPRGVRAARVVATPRASGPAERTRG